MKIKYKVVHFKHRIDIIPEPDTDSLKFRSISIFVILEYLIFLLMNHDDIY